MTKNDECQPCGNVCDKSETILIFIFFPILFPKRPVFLKSYIKDFEEFMRIQAKYRRFLKGMTSIEELFLYVYVNTAHFEVIKFALFVFSHLYIF